MLVLFCTKGFYCVEIDERKAQERVLAVNSMKMEERQKLNSGNTEPYAR